MDSDRYTIILRKEVDDGEESWVARVAELPGCTAVEESTAEVLTHIRGTIQSYLRAQGELGRAVPPPAGEPSGRFTVRVPSWVHRALKLRADAEEVSLNQYVSTVLAYWAGRGDSGLDQPEPAVISKTSKQTAVQSR